MALIKCPECGHLASDKAVKCPKCGYPIQEYLNGNIEKAQIQPTYDASTNAAPPANIQPAPDQKKNKIMIAVVVACVVILAVLGTFLVSQLFAAKLTVENITIDKWRLTDSTEYEDYYEGTVTSDQKSPFIAVIGEYQDKKSSPRLVYREDGIGVLKTYEETNEDPSIKYRAIGYMSGKSINLSDIKVKYTDSDYYDWSYSDYTSCDVLIDLEMNNTKTGLLVFDIINETTNETEKNIITVVVNGKAFYTYFAKLPYKARGIDVSIVPKLFCESASVARDDYVITEPYTAEKEETSYSNSYWGEETLTFTDYANGFILYTKELKEGGSPKNKNVIKNSRAFLCDEECILTTYDYVNEDETILMPKYEFNIIGYITWKTLEKEIM